MKKIDKVIINETKYIAVVTLVLSVLMQSVFLVLQKWNYTVLTGNVLSASAAVLNFFLMGISVQNALEKDEKDAKATMRLSRTYRMLMLVLIIGAGVIIPCFHDWAVIIPVFFPRIAIAFHPFFVKDETEKEETGK